MKADFAQHEPAPCAACGEPTPFDPEESRVLWDAFKPGAWNGLDEVTLNQKINELTAFHETYQLRGAGIQK